MKLEYASPESVDVDSTGLSKIEELTQQALEEKKIAALNMIAVRHGKIFYHKSFGKLNLSENSPDAPLDALNSVRSISKPITAVIIMMLSEKGIIGLDEPVQKYLPEFQGEGKDKVKIYHLLTHSTGMCDDDMDKYYETQKADFKTPDIMPAYFGSIARNRSSSKWWLIRLQSPLTKPTGKEMSYCNTGYNILGFIVKIATGKSIAAYAKATLFKPLGMSDTTYTKSAKQIEGRVIERIPSEGNKTNWMNTPRCFRKMSGCCSVSTTVFDLAIFGQMLLNNGEYDGFRVISEKSVELLTTNQIPGVPAIWGEFRWDEASWGYGFNTQGIQCNFPTVKAYSHGGFAGSFMLIDPILDIIIVTFKALNGDYSHDYEGLNEAVVNSCKDYESLKTPPFVKA